MTLLLPDRLDKQIVNNYATVAENAEPEEAVFEARLQDGGDMLIINE